MKNFLNLFIVALFALGLSACVDNINSATTPPTSCQKSADPQATFVGDAVPSIQKLIDDAKFDRFLNTADPQTWNDKYPRPTEMRIDDLMVIEIGSDMSPFQIVSKVKKMGYTLANSHESVVFATQNPLLQLTTTYYYASETFENNGYTMWIRFDQSVDAGKRLIAMAPFNALPTSKLIRVVVHMRHFV